MDSIDVGVEFSFRGEDYSLAATIRFSEEMPATLQACHAILARMNGVDTYSYLYEVMEQADLEFSNPQGLAARFLNEGRFDLDGFCAAWREKRIVDALRPVALRELGVDPDSDPGLKALLLEAWRLGAASVS